MCLVESSDEHVAKLSESNPKARKEHKCAECLRVINIGEQYHVDRYVYDGDLKNHKTCAHCAAVMTWLHDECGGWIYGSVLEDIEEHALEGYGIAVGRMAIGMRWKWRRKDGSLLPMPRIPKTSDDIMRAAAAGG